MKKKFIVLLMCFVLVFTSFTCYGNEEADLQIIYYENYNTMELVDGIEFSFSPDSTMEELRLGKSAEGRLEHYFLTGGTHYYIITINGSDSDVSLWTSYKAPLDTSAAKLSDNIPLQFCYEDMAAEGSLLMDSSLPAHRIHFKAVIAEGEVTEAKIKFIPEDARVISTDMSDALSCTEASYEKYVENDIDLSVTFGEREKPGDENAQDAKENNEDEEVKETEKEESRVYSQTFVGDINKYVLREKFYFTFTADKSFEGVLTDEVANLGEEVSAEVRIYLKDLNPKRNGEVKFYNVTILEGSKGKAQLWGGFDYELDYFPLYKPTDMVMHAISANRYLTGSYYEPLVRYSGEGVENHRFMIKPEFDGNEIKGIKIKYVPEVNGKYDTYATMDGAAECDNVKYELLVPLTEMTEKEKEEEEALEERNPEKYVTTVRGKMRDGSYHDYRINSVYQVSLDELEGDLPEWYEELGNDVNLYLLSFTQVWDGKDRNNYTMVKFEGSRGRVWFINGNAEFGNGKNGGKYVISDYNSLISFDGFERVRNTVDYDTVTLSLDFAADEDMTVESIAVEVEGEEATLSGDEITYIGGGKLTYESFF